MTDDDVTEEWAPASCTLPTTERPMRVDEFDGLFATALRALDRPHPMRLVMTLQPAPGRAETVRDLTRRETECCSFFTFAVTEQDGGLLLDVAVPPAHVETLDAIAERAARVSGLGS
jgi:hypothetical protein